MRSFPVAISMTTCERKDPTIERSTVSLIKSIGKVKGATITTYVDEGKKLGCFTNFNRALRGAIRQGKEFVLVVPDDMTYSEDWIKVATTLVNWSDTGFLALYTPRGVGERYKLSKGVSEIKGGWAATWGSSYLMRTDVAEKVIGNPFYISHLYGTLDPTGLYNYEYNKRIDHCIPEVMHRLQLKQLFYAPSLCTHIGYNSTIGHIHTQLEDAYLR